MTPMGRAATRGHELAVNGVMIVRTPTGIGVWTTDAPPAPPRVLTVEVWYLGVLLKSESVDSYLPWRDFIDGADMLRCVVKVRDGDRLLAELSLPDEEYPLPFMVLQGAQRHVTESYVSVPPALTITDERGDVWTLGFAAAPKWQSPDGEFAFDVLRNGVGTGEVASRIDRRSGKVKIFTHHGWKTWNGSFFF